MSFVREQGVVGLAVGLVLGGAVGKMVSALVLDFVDPLIGMLMGKVNLADKLIEVGDAKIMWGHFLSTSIDFLVLAGVVYFGVKWLKLDKLDKK
jgi:large conductance mechanosensitive channel